MWVHILSSKYILIVFSEQPVEELAPLDQTLEKEHEEKTKVKNIQVNLSLHETLLEELDDYGCLRCTR